MQPAGLVLVGIMLVTASRGAGGHSHQYTDVCPSCCPSGRHLHVNCVYKIIYVLCIHIFYSLF